MSQAWNKLNTLNKINSLDDNQNNMETQLQITKDSTLKLLYNRNLEIKQNLTQSQTQIKKPIERKSTKKVKHIIDITKYFKKFMQNKENNKIKHKKLNLTNKKDKSNNEHKDKFYSNNNSRKIRSRSVRIK